MADRMFCPACGTIDVPKSYRQGSLGVSILLLLVFFPAAIAYEVWRYIAPTWVCPSCRKGGMVPLTTPAGKAALEKSTGSSKPVATRPAGYVGSKSLTMEEAAASKPLRYMVSGIDRETEMETVDYIMSTTPENAKAKAELRGILVTRIEKA